MKKLLFSLFALFLTICSVDSKAQVQADNRLYACFSETEIVQMLQQTPLLISYYNYYLDNSYYVVDLKTAEKEVTGIDIQTVVYRAYPGEIVKYFDLKDYAKEKFNPLQFQFNLQKDAFVTYVWKDAGVAIVFKPLTHISITFKEFLKTETVIEN